MLQFPKPADAAIAMRSVTDSSVPVLTLTDASVGYPDCPAILTHLTMHVSCVLCVGVLLHSRPPLVSLVTACFLCVCVLSDRSAWDLALLSSVPTGRASPLC